MATSVNQSFSEYRSNLEITNRQTSLVSSRRSSVVDAIASKLSLHNERSKVAGSYDRRTLTRYLAEGDVDVFVVLHYDENKQWDNEEGASKALDRFKAILDDAYPDTPKRRDRNCISMSFSEFKLDVVPAFKNNGGYYQIPDSIRRKWLSTDPFKFAEKITAINANMDSTFVPLIKMVKGWNREVGWPIRSFHLECMMHRHYLSYMQGYTYDSMLKVFFNSLPWYLNQATYDPVMSDRVDTYLDNQAAKTRRDTAIEKAQAAASASSDAYSLREGGYEEAAIRKWKSLLGNFFPSYG